MLALEGASPGPAVRDERPSWGVAILNPILASAAALFLILFAGAGAVPPRSALLVSVLAGIAVFVWNRLPWRLIPGSV